MDLREYLTGIVRHGWGESWIPELSVEQLAAISAIAHKELHERLSNPRPENED